METKKLPHKTPRFKTNKFEIVNLSSTGKEKSDKEGNKGKDGDATLAYAIRNGVSGETNLETLDYFAGMNPKKFKNYSLSWLNKAKNANWDNLRG